MSTATTPPRRAGGRLSRWRRPAIAAGAVALAAVVYAALPEAMGELPRRAAAIFVIAALFWATEVIPLYATSLCIIALQVLLLASDGGLAPEGELGFEQFFRPFASSVIILFMGGFLLAAAVRKHGLDRAIAAKLLPPFMRGPLMLIYGVMAVTAFFSMWMSNTATTAMMLAVTAPLLGALGDSGRFRLSVILAVPIGANIGGIGTPISSPPNAVALAALRQAGFEVGFLDWMIVAVPLLVLLLAISGVLVYLLMSPEKGMAMPALPAAEPITGGGRLTLAILGLTIVLWLTGRWHGVTDAVVALLAAAGLTALGALDRRDVDSIDWNILLLMWGGLSLGNAMQLTGLIDQVMALPLDALRGVVLAAVFVVIAVGLSSFMSNTAAANLIIPMALAFPAAERGQLVVLTALACSFAMALPISTPPNAMAFATGVLPARTLLRVGGVISAVAIVILLAGYQVVLPMFLRV